MRFIAKNAPSLRAFRVRADAAQPSKWLADQRPDWLVEAMERDIVKRPDAGNFTSDGRHALVAVWTGPGERWLATVQLAADGDWIVCHANGKIRVMLDEHLREHYQLTYETLLRCTACNSEHDVDALCRNHRELIATPPGLSHAAEGLLALSGVITMPPFPWVTMQPHCVTCFHLHGGPKSGEQWSSWNRSELRLMGAKQIATDRSMYLVLPLHRLWSHDAFVGDPPGWCFLHEVTAQFDNAWRSLKPFGVQDLTSFQALAPLDDRSHSKA